MEVNKGVRSELTGDEVVMRDGKLYRRTEFTIDYGPKLGRTRVTVCDPCVSEAQQEARRRAIVAKCEELMRRGLM